jgi:RNA polymerase sigma factor (sigma-70 family)
LADVDEIVTDVVRREQGRITGGLLRLCGSLDEAEDALQEAILSALEKWTASGVPENPGAWLTTVAKNVAKDKRRHRGVREAKSPLLVEDDVSEMDSVDTMSDDYLRLIFTCCHPDLTSDSQIALTLKVVVGFSMEEIARAFVCPEATVSQRILRAKKTIEEKKLVYVIPENTELTARVAAALRVVYLMFNEGHTSRTGPLMRLDLQVEALRLGRLMSELVPNDPEVFGLVALMAFGAARAGTRVEDDGTPILLADQDRALWDRELLREGLLARERMRVLDGHGPYALQAEIAACHMTAETWEKTDWERIVTLYDGLVMQTDSPIVALNRAIAVAMCRSPEAGLAELRGLDNALDDYHLFHATRADLIDRAGGDPVPDLKRALALVTNDGERRLLERRIAKRTS